MSNYLLKYKGKYRLKLDVDQNTMDFPRTLEGNIEDIDMYISCQNNNKIFHYGHGVLNVYIPSIGRGHNIIKTIFTEHQNGDLSLYTEQSGQSKDGEITYTINYDRLYKDSDLNYIIFDIVENDEEIEFKFKAKDIDLIAPLLKPKTSGASISPTSTKNLPKSKVEIPMDEIERYKKITAQVNKGDLLVISRITSSFLCDILQKRCSKKDKKFNYKSDSKKMCLGTQMKEYIYTKGFWKEYLEYLEKEINSLYNKGE